MFTNAARRMLVLILVLAACCGPALAQSTRNQGPATTPSQNYSYPGGAGPSSLLVLVLSAGLVAFASASAGYWMVRKQR